MEKELSFEQAKEKALRLLEFRSHSERELSDKLRRAGAKNEDIEEILDFCRNYGFVDDKRYAQRKAKDLQHLKKFGRRRIEQELYAKGISSVHIAEAIAELDFEDAEDTLCPLVRKKLGGSFEKKSIDRCIRYFIYRGYDISDIKSCIEKIKNEEAE